MLKRWFKQRRVLLVLDNFEGVLQAADLVEDLLANCPDLRVLPTSRAPCCRAAAFCACSHFEQRWPALAQDCRHVGAGRQENFGEQAATPHQVCRRLIPLSTPPRGRSARTAQEPFTLRQEHESRISVHASLTAAYARVPPVRSRRNESHNIVLCLRTPAYQTRRGAPLDAMASSYLERAIALIDPEHRDLRDPCWLDGAARAAAWEMYLRRLTERPRLRVASVRCGSQRL
jgi:hypothetical protein